MKYSDTQIVVTLVFEGATYLTTVKDKKATELKNSSTTIGNFAGCELKSNDVELNRHACTMDIKLSEYQVDGLPSRSEMRQLNLPTHWKKAKDAEKIWKKLPLEVKIHHHAADLAHDRQASSFIVSID